MLAAQRPMLISNAELEVGQNYTATLIMIRAGDIRAAGLRGHELRLETPPGMLG